MPSEKTLTPDNLTLLLTTPRGDEIALLDYAVQYANLEDDRLLEHARDFIRNRKAKLEQYVLHAFTAMIELGAAFELLFERLPYGDFERFVVEQVDFDVDTVRNYRNVYRHFAALLLDVPEQALQNLNWRMLYKLATRTVAAHCREWFVKYISDKPETASDERLVEIARYLPVELRARFDRSPPELSIEQAHSLALAYKSGLDAYIYRLVIDKHVKDGSVATTLNRLYLEMSAVAKRDLGAAAHKTFAEIIRHDYRLVWFDLETGDNDVALSDATSDTMVRYLAARRRAKMPLLRTERATGTIKRIGGSLYVKINDVTALPNSYRSGDEILVDLIIKES